jgi:hypothetical protein
MAFVFAVFLVAVNSKVMAAEPRLFYFEKQAKDRCIAKVRGIVTGSESTLFIAPDCTRFLVWDRAVGRLVYATAGHVWSRQIPQQSGPANGDAAQDLGSLPTADLRDLWIDRTSGAIRIAYLVPIPETSIVKRGDPLKGGKAVYRFEGQEYEAGPDSQLGLPYVAIVSELAGQCAGSWKQLEVKATAWGAGDTPGTSVLSRPVRRREDGYLAATIAEMTCDGGRLNCEVTAPAVQKLLGPQDGYGAIELDTATMVVFPVAMGDTPHASGPVYLCKKPCKSGIQLKDIARNEQLALASAEGYLLVTGEYENNNARVYDGAGKNVLHLPLAEAAIWFPEQ